MALKNCPQCGKPISDKAPQCPHCGNALHTENQNTNSSMKETTVAYNNPKNNNGKGGKMWILAVVALLIIGAGVGYYFYSDHQKQEAAAMEQARQDSIAQAQADSIRMVAVRDSIEKAKIAEEKEKQALKITHFCKWDSSNKVMTQRNVDAMVSTLKSLGFSVTAHSKKPMYSDAIGEYEEINYTLERDLYGSFIKIEITQSESLSTEITFADSQDRDNFIATFTANKFKKSGKDSYSGGSMDCYWMGTDITVKGNSVTLDERFEA